MTIIRTPLADRLWANVNKNGPMPTTEAISVHPDIAGQCCWMYGTSRDCYKIITLGGQSGKVVYVHRAAWFLETGEWPEFCVLHKCDRRACVRFSHLFQGTIKDNTRDMIAKERDKIMGYRNSIAKLTPIQVAEIRALNGLMKQRDIAKDFGVCQRTINKILNHISYSEEVTQ
jgi:HNH endonuclease